MQEDLEEELTSGSDEDVETNKNDVAEEAESSDSECETAQEKKLRLAKIYLEEIAKKERKRLNNEDEDERTDSIAKILKEDYLKSAGKLHSSVANQYVSADLDNISVMKCKNHKASITTLYVSNKFIFSGSKDGTIVKWSLDENKKLGCIPFTKHHTISNKVIGHSKMITSLAVSSDGKFLAASDSTRNIQIWDSETLKHVETLKGHQDSVTGLVFRRNTHTLYSCSKDRSIKVWSLDEMAYVETLYGHQNHITSIDALTRERAITSGGMDSTIRVWKIVEESQLIYNGPSASIDIVRLLNEETFISGSADGAINVWGVNKKKPLCTYKEAHGCDPITNEPYWICSIGTLTNTDLIATGSQDGHIKLWKLNDNFKSINLLFTIDIVGFINDISFTEDGRYLIASVGNEHKFGRWNVIREAKNCVLKIPFVISKKN
ncbi:WD40 domain-containing protein [Oryctes borbonicus]|uniref:WD40 domain-containing protein n=1 Tax=Oryctes borbonicus TaxID=1629725 RepID=A0A0T6B2W4_9SCAR|nr:WD40 domain-containing protein [Oryctes borbonicus]